MPDLLKNNFIVPIPDGSEAICNVLSMKSDKLYIIFTYCSCPVGMLCWSFSCLSSSKTNIEEHLFISS